MDWRKFVPRARRVGTETREALKDVVEERAPWTVGRGRATVVTVVLVLLIGAVGWQVVASVIDAGVAQEAERAERPEAAREEASIAAEVEDDQREDVMRDEASIAAELDQEQPPFEARVEEIPFTAEEIRGGFPGILVAEGATAADAAAWDNTEMHSVVDEVTSGSYRALREVVVGGFDTVEGPTHVSASFRVDILSQRAEALQIVDLRLKDVTCRPAPDGVLWWTSPQGEVDRAQILLDAEAPDGAAVITDFADPHYYEPYFEYYAINVGGGETPGALMIDVQTTDQDCTWSAFEVTYLDPAVPGELTADITNNGGPFEVLGYPASPAAVMVFTVTEEGELASLSCDVAGCSDPK